MSEETGGGDQGAAVAFAAGVASQRSEQASETAESAAAAAETAVAVADSAASSSAAAADAAHERAAAAEAEAYDARSEVAALREHTDARIAELLEALQGQQGGNQAPAPARRETPAEDDGDQGDQGDGDRSADSPSGPGQGTDGPVKRGAGRKRERADGFHPGWFGSDPE